MSSSGKNSGDNVILNAEFNILAAVSKCICDDEKFPASKKASLLETIRPELFRRFLGSDAPDPTSQYRKFIALKVLVEFCRNPKLATHPNVIMHAKQVLDIVCKEKYINSELFFDTLDSAYTYLNEISQFPLGQLALIEQKAVEKLCHVYLKTYTHTDTTLQILTTLVNDQQYNWADINPTIFHKVLNKIASSLCNNPTIEKYNYCMVLTIFLYLCPTDFCTLAWESQTWPHDVLRVLDDILDTKKRGNNREGALILAATILNILGTEWPLFDSKELRKLFIHFEQAALLEIRVRLKNKSLKTVMTHADLICACLTILETVLLHRDVKKFNLNDEELVCLNKKIDDIFHIMMNFLKLVTKDMAVLSTPIQKRCVLLMIRLFGRWLCQNEVFVRLPAAETLSIILDTANASFYAEKKAATEKSAGNTDLLRQILFLIDKFVSNDNYRRVLLQKQQDKVLYECLDYYWAIFHDQMSKDENDSNEMVKNYSRKAVTELTIIFRNIIVFSPEYIKKSPLQLNLREFFLNNYSELLLSPDNFELFGHMAIVSIYLLLPKSKMMTDPRVVELLDTVIWFLRDVVDKGESRNEVRNVWRACVDNIPYLTMNVAPFVDLDKNLNILKKIIGILRKVTNNDLRVLLKPAFEDLFYQMLHSYPIFAVQLRNFGLLNVLKDFQMSKLEKFFLSK